MEHGLAATQMLFDPKPNQFILICHAAVVSAPLILISMTPAINGL
ncbi:hypothetical protein [Scytonema sp. NUACC21]